MCYLIFLGNPYIQQIGCRRFGPKYWLSLQYLKSPKGILPDRIQQIAKAKGSSLRGSYLELAETGKVSTPSALSETDTDQLKTVTYLLRIPQFFKALASAAYAICAKTGG